MSCSDLQSTADETLETAPPIEGCPCRYVGKCLELPLGFWVGVEYDEPVGKNDGSIKETRYFTAAQNYGGMARPANVAIRDFPPEDFEFSDGDEI